VLNIITITKSPIFFDERVILFMKLKKQNFLIYHYELFEEYKVTLSAREVFALLYRHCMTYHDSGYFGFSNEWIMKELSHSKDIVIRALKELREKELIIIEKPGKRTTKTGESRMIYINAKNFIFEKMSTADGSNEIISQLVKENEKLKKEVADLRQQQSQTTHITNVGYELIKTGFITESRYKKDANELNPMLIEFNSWHRGGLETSRACFRYWQNHKSGQIKNYVAYIDKCIMASKNWVDKNNTISEDYSVRIKRMISGAAEQKE
jgi:hypothetical protein